MLGYIAILAGSAAGGLVAGGSIGGTISERISKPTGTFADGFALLPGMVIGGTAGAVGGVILAAALMR